MRRQFVSFVGHGLMERAPIVGRGAQAAGKDERECGAQARGRFLRRPQEAIEIAKTLARAKSLAGDRLQGADELRLRLRQSRAERRQRRRFLAAAGVDPQRQLQAPGEVGRRQAGSVRIQGVDGDEARPRQQVVQAVEGGGGGRASFETVDGDDQPRRSKPLLAVNDPLRKGFKKTAGDGAFLRGGVAFEK